jgi:hypothetical protein
MGRPSKYDEAHCAVAESILAQGYSEAVLAGELGVCLDSITEWKNVHPEFSASVKRGRALGAKVWEDRLAKLADKGEGNATGIIFGLKNRVPAEWRDKTEHEHGGPGGGPIVTEIRRTLVDPRNTDA